MNSIHQKIYILLIISDDYNNISALSMYNVIHYDHYKCIFFKFFPGMVRKKWNECMEHLLKVIIIIIIIMYI